MSVQSRSKQLTLTNMHFGISCNLAATSSLNTKLLTFVYMGTFVSSESVTSLIVRRAILLKNGRMRQITDALVGTNEKPLVLVDGKIKQRSASEGTPLIYVNGKLRTLNQTTESLLI